MAGPGDFPLEEKLFDRTTGAIPVGSEEGSKVVSEERQGHKATDYGAAGMEDGLDHHSERSFLEWLVVANFVSLL